MPKKDYLKSKNLPIITIFIVWCLALYVTFISSNVCHLTFLFEKFEELNTKDSIVIILSPILVLIFTGIISSANKARLVFWRIKNALPGHRAFSKLVNSDPRIDIDLLINKIGPLPTNPKDQNTKWFSIYKRVSDAITVKESHKMFLLSRDLSTISFLFSIFGALSIYIFRASLINSTLYLTIMIVHYIIFLIIARNHGNRFICNVLVEYLYEENP